MGLEARLKWDRALKGLALALVYFLAAKAGLTLAFVQSNATAVWPPTGIALAALLLGGWRLWPGIFLGAFLANLTTAGSVATSLGIAAGNSLEALCAFGLISRWARGQEALDRAGDLLKFAFLGGLAAPTVSATIGVSTLFLGGLTGSAGFRDIWTTWWLGDMGGALLVAPPILLWSHRPSFRRKPARILEGAAMAASLLAVGWTLFGGQSSISLENTQVQFLLIPILLWAAVRFEPFTASLVLLFISLFAIHGTLHGVGPFHGQSPNQSLLFLQAFMSVTSVAVLALAASVAEQKKAEEDLRFSHASLQLRVLERTEDLTRSNMELKKEIREKNRLEEERRRLALLVETSRDFICLCAVDGVMLYVNREGRRLTGLEEDESIVGLIHEDFIPPAQVPRLQKEVVAQLLSEGHWEGEFKLRHFKTGADLPFHFTAVLIKDPATGEPQAMAAIGRDITQQKISEAQLRLKSAALQNSEKYFRALIENALDIVTILDAQGKILFESPSITTFLGFDPLELNGVNVFTLVHPDDLPQVQTEFRKVLENPGAIGNVKFRFKHKDGSWRVLESIGTNLLADDAIGGIVVNSRDMTLEVEAQRALEEREERLRLLIENVQDYEIILLDPEGKVMTWNIGAQRIQGYEASEIIGRFFSCFYTSEDMEARKPEGLLKRALETGRVEDEGWRIRKDGSRFWADTILTALRDEKGKPRGFVKITRDITQRKQLEELSRSNQELEQFAYVASHDLQEPLRMVASYVQLLARKYSDRLDEDAKNYIDQAVDGAKRMQVLIKDLLAYSRVANQPRNFERVGFEEVLAEALRNLDRTIRETGARITHDPLPEVTGDPSQFLQMLQNLLANALKFKGKDPPRIHLAVAQRKQEWLFSLKDNGIGIDPLYAERIFEIFKRLHTRSEYPGTGIGLAICRKVVAQHGGRIWVESKEGEGATFYWTLPLSIGVGHETRSN